MMCSLNCSENVSRGSNRDQVSASAPPSPSSSPMSRKDRRSRGTAQSFSISRDDVLVWLNRCQDDDVTWVLRSILQSRPHNFAQFQANAPLLDVVEGREEKAPGLWNTPEGYRGVESMQEKDVVAWMLKAEQQTVSHIVTILSEERAQLFEHVIEDVQLKRRAARSSTALSGGRGSLMMERLSSTGDDGDGKSQISNTDGGSVHETPSAATVHSAYGENVSSLMQKELQNHPPRVGLTSSSYFTHEGDQECSVEVMRFGNLDMTSSVRYRTKDWSAKAGESYLESRGELVFRPGESLRYFTVSIMDDDHWHTTLEFIVELLEEGLHHAVLDYYLSTAKVKVIDNDAFPTNKFKHRICSPKEETVQGKKTREAPFGGLFLEYVKMTMQHRTVRIGCWKQMMLDQLHNSYFVLKLFMNVYLVDMVLKGPEHELFIIQDKELSLVGLALLTIVPFMLLFLLDQRKFGWRVAGTSRAILQSSLLRKFLNYDEDSRRGESKGDLLMAMTRDSVKLVHDGFLNYLELIKELGKIFCFLVYQVSAPSVFDRPFRPLNIILPTVAFPVLLGLFLCARMNTTTSRFLRMNDAQDDLVDMFDRTVENYRLIADYSARSKTVDAFEEMISIFNRAATATGHCMANNLYFPKWITLGVVCPYIVWGGLSVLSEDMTLGIFLAELSVFSQLGEAWGNVYKVLLEMQTCSSALRRITRLENLETDLFLRSAISRNNRARTKTLRVELEAQASACLLEIDLMPIEIHDLHLAKSGNTNLMGGLRLMQGQLVALVGNRGQGKATLLKVFGGVILPLTREGDPRFFLPSHLRVLHISLEPMFFQGSLFSNLTFGVTAHTDDGAFERVESVCKKLGLNDETLKLLSDRHEHSDWSAVLSQTQSMVLNLARAFIANPEVMCIHKPTQVFDAEMSEGIMQTLAEHVKCKGLAMGENTEWERRPRTCIFTSSEWMNVQHAHSVVHVSKQHGIRLMLLNEVKPEMLC